METGWLEAMTEARIPNRYRVRVRERLVVLEYAMAHGNKPAARRFGFDPKTIRRWRNRWQADRVRGLVPRYSRY
jgi:transposase